MNLFKHAVVIGRGIRYTEKTYSPYTHHAYAVGIVHALSGGIHATRSGVCYLKKDPSTEPPLCFERAKDALRDAFSRYEGLSKLHMTVIALNALYGANLLRKTRGKPFMSGKVRPDNPVAYEVDGSGNDCPTKILLKAHA